MLSILRRYTSLLLALCTLWALVSCTAEVPEETTAEPPATEPEVTEPVEKEVETFNLIEEGKLVYTIVRPEGATQTIINAALMINKHVKNNGIDATLSDWADKTGEKLEILVGETKHLPDDAFDCCFQIGGGTHMGKRIVHGNHDIKGFRESMV